MVDGCVIIERPGELTPTVTEDDCHLGRFAPVRADPLEGVASEDDKEERLLDGESATIGTADGKLEHLCTEANNGCTCPTFVQRTIVVSASIRGRDNV